MPIHALTELNLINKNCQMQKPEVPENEKERLDNLKSFHVMDTLPEPDLDDLTRMASEICETPIALISLIDDNRQWFKSKVGLEITETPRELAFCAHAILEHNNYLIVKDARLDERFSDNPFVVNDPNIIFYAGVVLRSTEGYPLGTMCVLDHKPRELTIDQMKSLNIIARQAMYLLQIKKIQP